MRQFIIKFLLLSFLAVFLMPQPIFAVSFFFNTQTNEWRVDDQFVAEFFLNTNGDDINAIEGKIIFPSDILEVKKINDGNSIINFWIEKPKSALKSQIAFSGIIPGGYNDSQGLIFSITFLAKKEGKGIIEFSGVKALRNDGEGTEAPLAISNFQFLIFNPPAGGLVPQIVIPKIEDRSPPEEFTPQIAADPAIFDGKWFLVFAAQDKGFGIDRYEVCEGNRKCIVAESPYLLQNQNLDREIVVKATDKSGNERIAILPPQKPRAWYKDYAIIAILIIMAVAYFIQKILWEKRRK